MIRLKDRNRRLLFQEKTSVPDGYGGEKELWKTKYILWAQYLSGGGDERYMSRGDHAVVTGRFRFPPGRFDIDSAMRILEAPPGKDSVIYNILSVDLIKKPQAMEVRVKYNGQ